MHLPHCAYCMHLLIPGESCCFFFASLVAFKIFHTDACAIPQNTLLVVSMSLLEAVQSPAIPRTMMEMLSTARIVQHPSFPLPLATIFLFASEHMTPWFLCSFFLYRAPSDPPCSWKMSRLHMICSSGEIRSVLELFSS